MTPILKTDDMEKHKNPLSIKVIYWVTNIIFGLIILLGGGVLIFNIMVYTSFFGDSLQLHAQFPVLINVLEEGSLVINNTEVKVEMVEATSKIHFKNTPLFIARRFGTVMLIATLFIFYLFFVFRKIIVNVYRNHIFEYDNVELLRYLAYGLLAFWLFAIIYSRLAYAYLGRSLQFEHIEVVEDYKNFAGLLLLALFMWVLSHIFKQGVALQEEKDLTV